MPSKLGTHIGALRDDGAVLDLAAADPALAGGHMPSFIAGGAAALQARPAALAEGAGGGGCHPLRADPPAGEERLLRRQELPRACEGIRRLRLRRQQQGGGAGGAGGVHQARHRRHPDRRDHPGASRSQQLGRLRGRAGGGDRHGGRGIPRRRRAASTSSATPSSTTSPRGPAAQAPAMDHRQGHRRLLPDGPGDPDRATSADPGAAHRSPM